MIDLFSVKQSLIVLLKSGQSRQLDGNSNGNNSVHWAFDIYMLSYQTQKAVNQNIIIANLHKKLSPNKL